MSKPSKDKLVNDIESRLDDFFEGTSADAQVSGPTGPAIEKLKSVVLSIDWEITDGCLRDLVDVTDHLLPAYETDRPAHALLRMLQALGRYIQKRKAQSHPDAIKRIMSVYKSFEKLTQGKPTDENLKKRLVAKEIEAFKSLKLQVEAQIRSAGVSAAPQHDQSNPNAYVNQKRLEQAMIAVEKKLNAEVSFLKSKLDALQKELDRLRKA